MRDRGLSQGCQAAPSAGRREQRAGTWAGTGAARVLEKPVPHRCQVMRKLAEAQTEAFKMLPVCTGGINVTSITMAPECLDNLLPAGAGERREADYPCFAVTPAIMYHLDGSTANTSWVPARPFTMHLLLLVSSSAGGWPMAACCYTPASGFLLPNTPQLSLQEAKGEGFRQDTNKSPVVMSWDLSHVPNLHRGV